MPTTAGDWTVTTTLSETLSAIDNFDFTVDPDGIVFGDRSSIGLDIQAKSHIYDFLLNGTLGYQDYFGTAADIPADRLLPRASMSYIRRGKTTTATLGASYSLMPRTKSDGLEVETGSSTGDRQTVMANVSVVHQVNYRNDLTVSTKASRTDFIGGTGDDIPNSNLGFSASWLRRATKRTEFTLAAAADRYRHEDAGNSEDYLYSLRGGAKSELTPRLTVNVTAGPQFQDSYDDIVGHSRDFGILADAGFIYLIKNGSLTGAATYGVTPNSDGELENSLGVRLGLDYQINELSQFHLAGRLRLTDSAMRGSLTNSTFSLSPSYTYTLARDWLLTARYQFALTDDEDGLATQNSVFITLSRTYTLIP